MELIKNLVQVKNNWKPLKQWEFEQQKNENIDDVLRKKYIPTKESIEKERLTMDEVQQRLDEFEAEFPIQPRKTTVVDNLGEDDEPFDPHTFDPTNLE